MRLHRFFVNELVEGPLEALPDGEVRISDKELIHQWKDVFRLKAGDDVILLDNTGNEYLSNISELHKEEARLHIAKAERSKNIPKRKLVLYCSLIKKGNFELVLEKGTELGVSTFVPIISERSEKKDLNMDRARKIIKEASEQSERGILPELGEVESLNDALEKITQVEQIIVFDPSGEPFDIPARHGLSHQAMAGGSLGLGNSSVSLDVFIGPEGGWSERELELFKEKNIPIYSLGTQVLRAETAAIAISSIVLLSI